MGTDAAPTYWYAPFDNAAEMALAQAIAPKLGGELIVQSCTSRFGVPLPHEAESTFTLCRDLPPPAGEGGGSRSAYARWNVAKTRADRRRELIRQVKPSLVHLHTFNVFTDWREIPRLAPLGAPIIQSIHNVRPQERILPDLAESWLLRRAYSAVDHLIVAHQRLADWLVDDFSIEPAKISVVPLPVLPDEFIFGTPSSIDGTTTFLFFGTLRRNKGIRIYLDAIADLRAEDNLRFVFAGRGDSESEAAILEASRADPRIVAEIGYVEKARKAQLYAEADVVVLPYLELPAQSGVLKDACAAGRPVLGTDVGALGPAIREEGVGWVIPSADVVALQNALRQIADAGHERQRRGQVARDLCASRVPDRITDQLLAVYDRVRSGFHLGA